MLFLLSSPLHPTQGVVRSQGVVIAVVRIYLMFILTAWIHTLFIPLGTWVVCKQLSLTQVVPYYNSAHRFINAAEKGVWCREKEEFDWNTKYPLMIDCRCISPLLSWQSLQNTHYLHRTSSYCLRTLLLGGFPHDNICLFWISCCWLSSVRFACRST